MANFLQYYRLIRQETLSLGMNEIDIHCYLILDKYISNVYKNVIASDELKQINNESESIFIVNTDPGYMKGTHWVAIYSKRGYCELFDSLGNDPSKYGSDFKQFMNQYETFVYSNIQIQSINSTKCGIFCIYYCYYKARGYSIEQIVDTFSTDTWVNNDLIDLFMQSYKDRLM